MNDETPAIPISHFNFDDQYSAERKAKCRGWQERALQGDQRAMRALKEIGLTRWERDGRRVI